jgi:hypothetical protein
MADPVVDIEPQKAVSKAETFDALVAIEQTEKEWAYIALAQVIEDVKANVDFERRGPAFTVQGKEHPLGTSVQTAQFGEGIVIEYEPSDAAERRHICVMVDGSYRVVEFADLTVI